MKKVFVTGAGSAIAHEACKIWAARKYQFFLVDKDEHKLKAVASDLRVRGATSVSYTAKDLTSEGAGALVVQEATIAMESIGVVLIAHGFLGTQKEGEESSDHLLKIMDINLTSAISVLTHLTKSAQNKRMTIGVISSVAGDRGREGNYIYGAAKGGLAIFADGLRNRLSSTNIHVLTIKPGFVDTPMTKDFDKKGLLWSKPGRVARDIVSAMDKKKDIIYTPWFWRYIMLVIKVIPERIFKKMSI
jgi:decaprenylphospho-beta-D-erythro-pentofuranosid-2-ulose 2-reductase